MPQTQYVWAKLAQALAPHAYQGNPYSLLHHDDPRYAAAINLKDISLTLDKIVAIVLKHAEWPSAAA